jgi:hypothetical protein
MAMPALFDERLARMFHVIPDGGLVPERVVIGIRPLWQPRTADAKSYRRE